MGSKTDGAVMESSFAASKIAICGVLKWFIDQKSLAYSSIIGAQRFRYFQPRRRHFDSEYFSLLI